MITQEEYLVIHRLSTLGYSISQIARELGLDRKEVRTHLRRPSPTATAASLRGGRYGDCGDDPGGKAAASATPIDSCRLWRYKTASLTARCLSLSTILRRSSPSYRYPRVCRRLQPPRCPTM